MPRHTPIGCCSSPTDDWWTRCSSRPPSGCSTASRRPTPWARWAEVMLRATLKNLAARKLRLGLSAFAVILGVAFVAGSYIFTDTLNRTFDELFSDMSADVVVRPATDDSDAGSAAAFGWGTSVTGPADVADDVADVDGVAYADGSIENSSVYVLDPEGDVIGTAGTPGVAVSWNSDAYEAGRDGIDILEGTPPGPGQVAIDQTTVDNAGFEVGDQIDFVTSGETPRIQAELTAVIEFDDGTNLAGASLSMFDVGDARELFLGGQEAFTSVGATAAE